MSTLAPVSTVRNWILIGLDVNNILLDQIFYASF